MTPLEVIAAKRTHLNRMANEGGAAGEQDMVLASDQWVPRPKGQALRILLSALEKVGKPIKASSFDAISVPAGVDLSDYGQVSERLSEFVFIEIKSANQARVRPGFAGFFFALTENEIAAADVLGHQHRVVLYNKIAGEILITSVPELVARARSSTWQLSIQL